MPKRSLTAQDAFVGVRLSDETTDRTVNTAVVPSMDATFRGPSNDLVDEKPRNIDLKAIREAALAAERQGSSGAQDRLTLYLSPVVRSRLEEAWHTVRTETGIKVGKSNIALQALMLVLQKPDLLTQVLAETVRERATVVR